MTTERAWLMIIISLTSVIVSIVALKKKKSSTLELDGLSG